MAGGPHDGGGQRSSGSNRNHGHGGRRASNRGNAGSNNNDNNRGSGGGSGSGGASVLGAAAALVGAAALNGASEASARSSSSSSSSSSSGDYHYQPGQFDFYAFVQSWSPTFCCVSSGVCKKEGIDGLTDVSTHGLWPQFLQKDGSGRGWPEYCNKPPRSAFEGMSGRLRHEYKKHGSCTRLSPSQYAEQEAALANSNELAAARQLLRANAGGSVATTELVNALGGPDRAAVKVDSKCRLEEMTTCWVRAGPDDDRVARRVPCPERLLQSGRNSAAKQGCVYVVLGTANSCAAVTDQMLKFLKGHSSLQPKDGLVHGPVPPPQHSQQRAEL